MNLPGGFLQISWGWYDRTSPCHPAGLKAKIWLYDLTSRTFLRGTVHPGLDIGRHEKHGQTSSHEAHLAIPKIMIAQQAMDRQDCARV